MRKKKFALKIFRHEYIENKELGMNQIQEEIKVLHGLDHPNITKMHGYGSDGKILKPSGQIISNLVYVMLEYVDGMLLFDKCQEMKGFGEEIGCGIMEQLTEVLTYLEEKQITHRDLKLENILVDDDLNVKVTDFGFAT